MLWHARLNVSVRVSLLGRKQFVMDYLVDSQDGERLVSGATVQVMYYYLAAASKRLPVDVRDRVIVHEWSFDRVGGVEGVGVMRYGDRYNSKGLLWQSRSGTFSRFYSRIFQDPVPASESSKSSVATVSRAASLSKILW